MAIAKQKPREKSQQTRKPFNENCALSGLDVENITPSIAGRLNLEDTQGVIVSAVQPGSKANTTGIKRADAIEKVVRLKVNDVGEFKSAFNAMGADENVLLTIRRSGTQMFVVVPS